MAEKSTNWIALAAPTAVAGLVLGVAAAAFWFRDPAPPSLQSGVLLQQPRPVGAFALTDQDGRPFDVERLRGSWTVLFAGFTHCPDVCPTTLALLRQVESSLRAERLAYHTVFLSLDPERDTPERLKQYVRYFSEDFIGATGPAPEIDRLCRDLGLAWVKVPGATDEDYTIDHSTALVLLNPRGEVAGYFQAPHRAGQLTSDLRRVLEWHP